MARVTIEDCLKVIDNAFDICSLAGRRAKDLSAGAEPLIESNDKPTVIALREISEEKIGMDYFEISNKEKIESQLFGSGITEAEVVNELSGHIEETSSTAITPESLDASDSTEGVKDEKEELVIETDSEISEITDDSPVTKSE